MKVLYLSINPFLLAGSLGYMSYVPTSLVCVARNIIAQLYYD